jgi:hypothetical protein
MVAEARRVCRELSAQALRSFARDLFLPLRTAAAKLSTNPKNLDNKATATQRSHALALSVECLFHFGGCNDEADYVPAAVNDSRQMDTAQATGQSLQRITPQPN